MKRLRYYDEDDIQKIANTARSLVGTEEKLRVSEMADIIGLRANKVLVNSKYEYCKFFSDISPYRVNKDSEGYYIDYPYLTYEDGSDFRNYIFAGFYHDEDLTSNISSSVTSGAAYARFIPIEGFRTHKTGHIYDESANTYIFRSAYTIPNLKFSKIGTEIKAQSFTTASAYSYSSNAYKMLYNFSYDTDWFVTAEDFTENSLFWSAHQLTSIPGSLMDCLIIYKPLYYTQCGTLVKTFFNVAALQDALNNNFSVSMFLLNSGKAITSFNFDVLFNANNFSYFRTIDCALLDEYTVTAEEGVIHVSGKFNSPTIINDTFLSLVFAMQVNTDTATGEASKDSLSMCKHTFKVINQHWYCNDEEIYINMPDLVLNCVRSIPKDGIYDPVVAIYDTTTYDELVTAWNRGNRISVEQESGNILLSDYSNDTFTFGTITCDATTGWQGGASLASEVALASEVLMHDASNIYLEDNIKTEENDGWTVLEAGFGEELDWEVL